MNKIININEIKTIEPKIGNLLKKIKMQQNGLDCDDDTDYKK